jgi:hypothetical protein
MFTKLFIETTNAKLSWKQFFSIGIMSNILLHPVFIGIYIPLKIKILKNFRFLFLYFYFFIFIF